MTKRPRLNWRAVPLWLFVVCAVNAVWSHVGGWKVRFAGVEYSSIGPSHTFYARRSTYVASGAGRLVIALRDSYADAEVTNLLGDGPPPAGETRETERQLGFTAVAAAGTGAPFWPAAADLSRFTEVWLVNHEVTGPGFLLLWESPNRLDYPWYSRGVSVSWWWLVLLASPALIGPASRQLRRRAARRRDPAAKLCVCGYDLRATPDRCPECGAVPERDA
jgi:hypothetical protein